VIIFFLLYYVAAFLVRILLLKSRIIERVGLIGLLKLPLSSSFLGVLIVGLSWDLTPFGAGLIFTGLAQSLIFPPHRLSRSPHNAD